jgi:uncharacterized protein (TIGR00251 family)
MIVEVAVVPKSGSFRITQKDGKLKIFLKSAPEDNKANFELITQLEKKLGCNVRLVSGAKSRHKKLDIGIQEQEWKLFLNGIHRNSLTF